MGLADCPKCWQAICDCGYEWRQYSLKALRKHVEMVTKILNEKEGAALPTWNSIMDYMTTTIEQLRESGLLHDEGEGGVLIMPNGVEMAVVKWHLTACSLFIETLTQLCHLNHPLMAADGWFSTIEGCRFRPRSPIQEKKGVSDVS